MDTSVSTGKTGKADARIGSDSITNVNIGVEEGSRKLVAFRCDGVLWGLFKKRVSDQGQSICHVLEGLVGAFVMGGGVSEASPRVSIDKVVVQRVVKRDRRHSHETGLTVVEEGSLEGCAFCKNASVFVVFCYPVPGQCTKYFVCGEHFGLLKIRAEAKGWRKI